MTGWLVLSFVCVLGCVLIDCRRIRMKDQSYDWPSVVITCASAVVFGYILRAWATT